MAGVQGIEPWPTVLETVVLPLNYTPMANSIQQIAHGFNEFSKILVFVLQTISLLLYASCVFGTIGSAFSLQAFFQLFSCSSSSNS